ncbi:PilN domain-containing protein [Lysobacter arenosi]|uniref:PilN domain-containing protein n=1 Tax=Lysobacter arenosi TaxID=2795387 RepID=A0ABX7RBS2_9GAMM|nr:PilN domain-containing protein [Lysobacter arenosi]QSX74866.1 PilN domain-containing protein [Lysobacter arenosi]
MARINLLPWREERRKLRQKEFAVMFAMAALGAVLLSFVIITYYNGQIDGQNERNTYMRDQITQVDKAIKEIEELDKKKAKLLARKEVIEELQANRSQMVHLFDSLVRTIPDGAVLTSIKQDSQTLTLEGRAQSNARVSTYMRNLEGSGWMTKPDLSIIEAQGTDKGLPYVFKLQVQLANPNAPKDEDGDGMPDAPAAQTSQIAQAADATAAGTAPAGVAPTAPAPGAAPAQPASTPASAPVATPANAPTAPAAAPTKGAAS